MVKIKKKKKTGKYDGRSQSKTSDRAQSETSQVSLVPRVASLQAWPRHKLNVRGDLINHISQIGQKAEEGELTGRGLPIQKDPLPPLHSGRHVDSYKIDYLNFKPTVQSLDKELTNNRIKIMNMKTDFFRLKKLADKIQGKAARGQLKISRKNKQLLKPSKSTEQVDLNKLTDPGLKEEALELQKMEKEFNITGVNQYKT